MVGYYNQGVPSGELENNGNQKKYTINKSPKGDLLISKPVCALMVIGAILLAVLAALLVFMLMPRCEEHIPPAALIKLEKDRIDETLPKNIEPLHYRIQLIPNLYAQNPTTNGAVTITLNTTEVADKIVLHAQDLDIDKKGVSVKRIVDDKVIQIIDQIYDEDAQKYTIALQESLPQNETYNLEIRFIGKINQREGIYLSKYKEDGSERAMVSTQFSPTDARKAFPCFDEPSFKSRFTISIARPTNVTSISNMPPRETSVHVDKKGWVWDNYQETPLMSTYLVAFVVSDLQPFKFNSSEKFFTVWCRRSAIDRARYAINLGPQLLHFYEEYFNFNFPLPKIDLVAVPDFPLGAMENWGLITFREQNLLFDDKSSTIVDKRQVAFAMAHELAHQWFGNLATPKWWSDLWLKEGFATYLEYLGVDHVERSWNVTDEFLNAHVFTAFEIDALGSSRPVSSEVHNNVQIRQQFDAISYSKGAALIRMVDSFLGEERFKLGLINYLNKYRYSNADHDDLWNSFNLPENSNILPHNVSPAEVMDNWILQPGFPVINVAANYTNHQLNIRQGRFLLSGEVGNGSWWIPVSAASQLSGSVYNSSPTFWLKNESEITTVEFVFRDWYLLNLKQTGYYIVNYDEANWNALILRIMQFPPIIRSQLISNSMDLARANMLDYHIPLTMIADMARADKHITYVPLSTAFKKLTFLHDILYTTSAYEHFNQFMQLIFELPYRDVHFNAISSDDSLAYVKQQIQREVLKWACKYSESSCTNKARHNYRAWTQETEITPNIREVVFCTGIREGTERERNFAFEKLFRMDVSSERTALIKALGECTPQQWLLSKYLDLTLGNGTKLSKQEGALLFESVASNPAGHQLAFTFLRDNWSTLKDYYGYSITQILSALPKYMNSPYELSELEEFKRENLDNLGVAEQALDRAIEIVRANTFWMQHSYKSVDMWLRNFNKRFVM